MSQKRKIGLIDGLLFLLTWSILGMASASSWDGAIPIIIFILVPASSLVAWRGSRSVEKIKNRTATNKNSAIEGGVWGLFASLALTIWSYSTQAHAAGTIFDNAPPNSLEFYKVIVTVYLPFILAGTILGSIHGVLFFNLNKILVKRIK